MYRSKAQVEGVGGWWRSGCGENAVWSTESWRREEEVEEEEEFWRGSALHRASARPLQREDYGEDWWRGEGQRRGGNEQVVKGFSGVGVGGVGGGEGTGERVGWEGGRGLFIGRVRQKGGAGRRGRRGRRGGGGETPVRWSVHWPLFAVFLCKLFGVLQELFTIFRVLLR